MSGNYDWDISNLRASVDRINTTLYGNGQEGITSKVNGHEDQIQTLLKFKDEWHNVTSFAEHKEMKKKVEKLSQDRWFILGVFSVINLLIVVFGSKLTDLF